MKRKLLAVAAAVTIGILGVASVTSAQTSEEEEALLEDEAADNLDLYLSDVALPTGNEYKGFTGCALTWETEFEVDVYGERYSGYCTSRFNDTTKIGTPQGLYLVHVGVEVVNGGYVFHGFELYEFGLVVNAIPGFTIHSDGSMTQDTPAVAQAPTTTLAA